MKIKIILVGMFLSIAIFGIYQYVMYQCGTIPVFAETPRTPNLWNCLEIWRNQLR